VTADDERQEESGPSSQFGNFAAEHLSPAFPQRAPWGTAQNLRAWQAEALEEYFTLDSIESDFPPVFERFYRSSEARTCDACGHLHPAPEKYL